MSGPKKGEIVKRILVIGLVAAALAALAPAANAYVTAPDGGQASLGVTCVSVFGGAQARGHTLNTSNYVVHFRTYVYSATFPSRSGWSGWFQMAPGTAQEIGNVATRGSGLGAVYVEYAILVGSQWRYGAEWLTYTNTGWSYCNV